MTKCTVHLVPTRILQYPLILKYPSTKYNVLYIILIYSSMCTAQQIVKEYKYNHHIYLLFWARKTSPDCKTLPPTTFVEEGYKRKPILTYTCIQLAGTRIVVLRILHYMHMTGINSDFILNYPQISSNFLFNFQNERR